MDFDGFVTFVLFCYVFVSFQFRLFSCVNGKIIQTTQVFVCLRNAHTYSCLLRFWDVVSSLSVHLFHLPFVYIYLNLHCSISIMQHWMSGIKIILSKAWSLKKSAHFHIQTLATNEQSNQNCNHIWSDRVDVNYFK